MQYQVLNNGDKIPMLGYGVFEIPDKECTECVLRAMQHGYRHIDTAQIYGNEEGVGRAIENCGLPRSELYITSKVWVKQFGYDKTLKSIDLSLKKLKTDYIDLMLLHRPYFDYINAWKALEKALSDGKVRAIGISNFNIKQTKEILDIAAVKPAVNQIELHPYFCRKKLKEFLSENGIAVEAWYPLGHGNKKPSLKRHLSASEFPQSISFLICCKEEISPPIFFERFSALSKYSEDQTSSSTPAILVIS